MPPMPLHRPRRLRAASERFADDEHERERRCLAGGMSAAPAADGRPRTRSGAGDAEFTEIIISQTHFRRKSYRLSASAEMDTTRHSFGCYGHGAVRHRTPARGSPTRRHGARGRSSPSLWPHGPSAHRRDDCPTVPAIQHPAILDPLSRARLRLRVLAKHGPRSRLLDSYRGFVTIFVRDTPYTTG